MKCFLLMRRLAVFFVLCAPAFAQLLPTGAGQPTNVTSAIPTCAGVTTSSTLVAHYDGSGLATGTTNSYGVVDGSGNVSQWNDLSGNGNNATATSKPTLNIAAANGLNTVQFMAASSQYFTLTSTISTTVPFTMVSVVRHGGPTGTANIVEFGNSTTSGSNPYSTLWYTNSTVYTAGTTYGVQTTGTQADTASYHLITTVPSGGGFIRFDRSALGVTGGGLSVNAGFTVLGRFYIAGANSYANGNMAELCFYSSALSSTDYTAVENALRTKWGTP